MKTAMQALKENLEASINKYNDDTPNNVIQGIIYVIEDLIETENKQISGDHDDFEAEYESGYISKLRDTFAGQAMNGLISSYGTENSFKALSETSYSIADEMLKQRKIKSDEK